MYIVCYATDCTDLVNYELVDLNFYQIHERYELNVRFVRHGAKALLQLNFTIKIQHK